MSYCRFSSDDFRCDVYVYESCHGGWDTHVAKLRTRGYIPRTGSFPFRGRWLKLRSRIWIIRSRLQQWYLEVVPKRMLGLPHDGETFNDGTAIDCARRLIGLRNMGYNVPQHAIDALVLEVADE